MSISFPEVDKLILEQDKSVFYGRITNKEEERVSYISESLAEFMMKQRGDNFLIAGVGGILRNDNPFNAKDIDLAVIGLKYTNFIHDSRGHTWNDVVRFTGTIEGYFDLLNAKLAMEYGLEAKNVKPSFGAGSGPFAGMGRKYESIDGLTNVDVESEVESFSWWGSKGLQVRFEDIRPIDIQFVFNQWPDEWKKNQEKLRESPLSVRRDVLERFPYAVLV